MNMEENKGIDMLNGLIDSYKYNKETFENYKKNVDEVGTQIKSIMQSNNLDEYKTLSNLKAKIIIQKRETFKDDMLIKKLKDLGVTSPIKLKEVVDMDELENVIYNHQLDAAELTDCKETKEVVTLKVTQLKGE